MLKTEMRNEKSMHIDQMDTLSMVRLINEENMKKGGGFCDKKE